MALRTLMLAGTLGITLAAGSSDAAWSTRWIVVAASPQRGTQPSQLFRVSTAGTGLRQITYGVRSADDPAFSPDGRRVAFTRGLSGLFVITTDGSGLRRLTDGRNDRYPVWAPDGRAIAFLRPVRAGFLLYVMKPNGRRQRLLRFAPRYVGRPSWMPDSKSIVVSSGGAFYEVSARNGRIEKRLRPTYDRRDGEPYWTLSPNGRTIALVAHRPEPPGCQGIACEVFALYLAGASSTRPSRFVDDAGPAGWSADSRTLVYAHGGALNLKAVAGGPPKTIAIGADEENALIGDAPPAWQP